MWGLTPQQVAAAFGVRAATVRSWEAGRSTPTGKRREAYRRFLQGLAQRADLQPTPVSLPASRSGAVAPPALAGQEPVAPPAQPAQPERGIVPVARRASHLPESSRFPRAAMAAVIGSAWVLTLVLLGAYLPGWAS